VQETTTSFAGCSCVFPAASTYTTLFARPLASTRISFAMHCGRSSRFPVASAARITVAEVLALESTSQP